MAFLEQLHRKLDELHLLKHCFYEEWTKGNLAQSTLQVYAKQYYHHVAAFPRYISAIHSQCDDISARQVLLGNLTEEEKGEENHPELWLRFAEGLGCHRDEAKKETLFAATKALVEGYYELARSSYAEGLGALYAYERQTPSVAKSKIDGLKEFYNIDDEKTLQFFTVHMAADEWHSDECAQLIEKLPVEEKEKVYQGAVKGAQLLWGFLDQMEVVHRAH